jgi:hypothetical protein
MWVIVRQEEGEEKEIGAGEIARVEKVLSEFLAPLLSLATNQRRSNKNH